MAKYDSLINDAKRAKGIPANQTLNGRMMSHKEKEWLLFDE